MKKYDFYKQSDSSVLEQIMLNDPYKRYQLKVEPLSNLNEIKKQAAAKEIELNRRLTEINLQKYKINQRIKQQLSNQDEYYKFASKINAKLRNNEPINGDFDYEKL